MKITLRNDMINKVSRKKRVFPKNLIQCYALLMQSKIFTGFLMLQDGYGDMNYSESSVIPTEENEYVKNKITAHLVQQRQSINPD